MFEFDLLPVELKLDIIEELDYNAFNKFKLISKSCYKFIYSKFDIWFTSFKYKKKILNTFDIYHDFQGYSLINIFMHYKEIMYILGIYGFTYTFNPNIKIKNIIGFHVPYFSRLGTFHVLLVPDIVDDENKYDVLCIVEPKNLCV